MMRFPPASASPPSPRLSDDLQGILAGEKRTRVPLARILRAIRGRGFLLFMVFLSLPFIIPVPLPGISTPVGILFMIFGLRLAFGRRPFWTRWLLRKRIALPTLQKLINRSSRFVRWFEKFLRPRMQFLQHGMLFRGINGTVIFFCGLALSLPIPIPASNFLPGMAMILLCAGMMEKDGLFILCGYFFAGISWIYLIILALLGKIGFEQLLRFWG
ncbi:MAG: exopolysaccharide biosynthesis protein [Verrucomicrobiae bacterium]|nr:exopolysaccharide biosynthesis protein [Verrucomicrobiae bacterium]